MKELTLKELDARLQKQVENAAKAVEKSNPSYAIDVCMNILSREPGCLDVRRVLRKAQLGSFASKSKGLTKFLSGVTNAPFMLKGSSQVKKDPKTALETAEKMLASNPTNPMAHKLLGQAADALGLSATTGAFAAGVLLAGNRYRAQIKADVRPFEGMLCFGQNFACIESASPPRS